MSENKLKRKAKALKKLEPSDKFADILLSLGLSAQDFMDFLESLALDFQVSILTVDEVDDSKTRVFNLWEQAFITKEAREFLLSALHTKAIFPSEMEQALALLFAQAPEIADVEEVRGILENIVEDPGRNAVLGPFNDSVYH
ncbi:MAG: hypothetical protein QM372_10065 [Bacillota bacterium]|jgi:DNA-binding NarL/FixJ family response regulator|nr:hypothetical protein [Bacillota bacterium]NLJ02757.1 hypothetical protein [Bacillota bacterium]